MNAGTAQQYARWTGILYLITIVAGGWGESHVPNTLLLAKNLAGTAQRVASSVGLFRSSFAAYLIEATCDITLNVLLYALLRPVSRNLSLLAACFGLMGDGGLCCGRNALLCRRATGRGCRCCSGNLTRSQGFAHLSLPHDLRIRLRHFAMFYGAAAAVRGISFGVPATCRARLAGVLIFGGASFIVKNFLVVLAPRYDLPYVIVPMFLAQASLMLWLLIKGVDRARWDAIQTAHHGAALYRLVRYRQVSI